MTSAIQEVIMPGDRDYIDRGLEDAARHANNGQRSEIEQVLGVEPSHHGGGDYVVIDVGTVGRPLGRAAISPFAPDITGGFIMPKRLQMPKVIGQVVVPPDIPPIVRG